MKVHFLDDDFSTNRYHEITLSSVAEEQGVSIEFFDHPITLLEHYEKGLILPELLFLDINMPMINGWEFLESFNKKFPSANTKVVILSSSSNPMMQEQSTKFQNIMELAVKPLTPEEFTKNCNALVQVKI